MTVSPLLMERVDAGVEWLNENLPDWRSVVDRKRLNMEWEETCVIGQYQQHKYGDPTFLRAVHAYFGSDLTRAAELGFLDLDFRYAELTAAWQQKFDELENYDNDEEAQS